jgi:hypothetical protein
MLRVMLDVNAMSWPWYLFYGTFTITIRNHIGGESKPLEYLLREVMIAASVFYIAMALFLYVRYSRQEKRQHS